ncbi:MAG: ferrous iron transport protein B, partial [Muribaculaceae bacterium]|nr:ferrous iron transport protein B [Muribaculaceae bacterium]
FKTTVRHMWDKGREYLKKMGGIILVGSIVVWALNYFPLHNDEVGQSESTAKVATVYDDSHIDPSRDSYLEMIGKSITPVMSPIGFHWRATIAVLAGVPAKEIVVSTLGVLYTGDEVVEDATLGERLKSSGDFEVPAALSLMVFILLYCPCLASVAAIARETGSWRYGAFSVLYNTALAWVAAFAVYRLALLF